MGKRKKSGGGKGRKRAERITRRDPEAKRQRRLARGAEDASAEDASAEDGDDDGGGAEDEDAGPEAEGGDAEPRAGGEAREDTDERPASADRDEDDDRVGLPTGAAWGLPLARFEKRWTWLEVRLLFAALGALVTVLSFWVCMRGMKEPLEAEEAAGTLFRALVGAAVLGGVARFATRGRMGEHARNYVTVAAVAVGLLTAKTWRGVGIQYFGGWLDWLQEGSSITLMGGLAGISTRLTMAVALLGASLASASAAHINIDVVVRFVNHAWRRRLHLAGTFAAATVCLCASYGFMDFIAVSGFRANAELGFGGKMGHVAHTVGEHWFVLRKQLAFDLGGFANVVVGKRWDAPGRLDGREWNELLETGGFVERYGRDKVDPLKAGADELDAPRVPFVRLPAGNPRGMLLEGMDLIFPIGFLMIGLRLLLRLLLVLAGHADVEHDAGPASEREPVRQGGAA
jgi:TRAP-type C4-dicarboxylate transport system permease small subunit